MAMVTVTAMAMFNGPRACQAARTRTTGQATSKERVIFALRRLQHPHGARAHARLRLQPSIRTNTLVRLQCGAKMRATAIQVTTTHEGIYEHIGITVCDLRDGPEVDWAIWFLPLSVIALLTNPVLSPSRIFVFIPGCFHSPSLASIESGAAILCFLWIKSLLFTCFDDSHWHIHIYDQFPVRDNVYTQTCNLSRILRLGSMLSQMVMHRSPVGNLAYRVCRLPICQRISGKSSRNNGR